MKNFLLKILEIFFPTHCLACDSIINKEALFCSICWPKLQFITEPKCKICSYPFANNSQGICLSCIKKPPSFKQVYTIFRYNEIIKKIIADLKYRDQIFVAQKLGKLLNNKIASELENIDFITIVPLHQKKLRKRKFNQVLLLANSLKKLNKNLIIYNDLLQRKKDNLSQTKLTQKQRYQNIKSSFYLNQKYREIVANKKILLLDDVMTTGATLEACAKVLKKAKAREVIVLTVAKTVLGN